MVRNKIFVYCILLIISCSPKQLVVYREGAKYGYQTKSGEKIVGAFYDSIYISKTDYNHEIWVKGKWGIIDNIGKFLVEPKYDYLSDDEEPVNSKPRLAQLNGLYGFINDKGKIIIPFIYQSAWGFENKICAVQKINKWGIINEKGDILIPFEYDDFRYPYFSGSEGLIAVSKNKKWGFVDRNNNMVIPFEYSDAEPFSEGLAFVSESWFKCGYINSKNEKVIPFIYGHSCGGFENNKAMVQLNDKYGYINKKGEEIIPAKYYSMEKFCSGYAAILIDNGESQFVNTGGWVLSGIYDPNKIDSEAVVQPEPEKSKFKIIKYGYVDSTGKEYLYDYPDFVNYKWEISPAPKEIPDSSFLLKGWDSAKAKWTLESMLAQGLTAFRQEPVMYPDLDRLHEVCIGCGLMITGCNYGEEFKGSYKGWQTFKEKTIYNVISSEALRERVWNWIFPYYKKSFHSLNPFVQKSYKDIALYLKNYINSYDEQKVRDYLKRDERKFAHYDMNGNYDSYRKLSACVDRLIIIRKIISVNDAKIWINKMADEVMSW